MDMNQEIKSVLRQLGVKTSYTGYCYTVYGISMVMKNKDCLKHITKSLYIDIAVKFKTSPVCVERDIRTVIETIWKTDNTELLYLICEGVIINRPTNKEFFYLMHTYFSKIAAEKEIAATAADINFMQEQCYTCIQTGQNCEQLKTICTQLYYVQQENSRLNNTIEWMHETIWKMIKRAKR